jgi:hypothetical protein
MLTCVRIGPWLKFRSSREMRSTLTRTLVDLLRNTVPVANIKRYNQDSILVPLLFSATGCISHNLIKVFRRAIFLPYKPSACIKIGRRIQCHYNETVQCIRTRHLGSQPISLSTGDCMGSNLEKH